MVDRMTPIPGNLLPDPGDEPEQHRLTRPIGLMTSPRR
jgi:hypothetical protein